MSWLGQRLALERKIWADHSGTAWLAVSVAACAAVMLIDISRLLGDIQRPDRYAYNAAVFTQPHIPNQTGELAEAIATWRDTQEQIDKDCSLSGGARCTVSVTRLIQAHLLIDVVFFCAYLFLLGKLLAHLTNDHHSARRLVISLLVIELVEAIVTLLTVARFTQCDAALVTLQSITILKWALLACILLWIAVALLRRLPVSPQHPARQLVPLLILIGSFGALVALPAGGPLEQLPDVVRATLEKFPHSPSWILTLVGVLLFASATSVAGLLSLYRPSTEPTGTLSNKLILFLAVLYSGALLLAYSHWTLAAAAPVIVIVLIWLAARLTGLTQPDSTGEEIHAPEAPPPPVPQSSEQSNAPESHSTNSAALTSAEYRWVAGAASAVILIAALGLVRAGFPPLILDLDTDFPAGRTLVAGLVLATVGRYLFYRANEGILQRTEELRFVRWSLIVVVVSGTAYLAIFPEGAVHFGSLGVVSFCFALFALVIGGVRRFSRSTRPWSATQVLSGGRHTPWLTILVAIWCVASALNTNGTYHDTRLIPTSGSGPASSPHTHTSLLSAFTTWVEKAQTNCSPKHQGTRPMVLVAASGGGIRAAHWTADALEQLFEYQPDGKKLSAEARRCALGKLFAISGVSGGSVGAATFIASVTRDKSAREQIQTLSEDRALAAAVAGFLLRDLAQPLVGAPWADRAAILEDGWMRNSVFAQKALSTEANWRLWLRKMLTGQDAIGPSLQWSQLRDEHTWTPILVLNASSVTDGCRILVTNVGSLPIAREGHCGSHRPPRGTEGSVSSSIDVFEGLLPREKDGKVICDPHDLPSYDMRAVTAALLSARFAFVSPTGAIVQCRRQANGVISPSVSYVVDGGYYENSGILTLLQMWAALQPIVRAYNEANPTTPVAPWIIVLDNAYRTNAMGRAAGRPRELLAPLRAEGNDNLLIEQEPLEQMAATALRFPPKLQCDANGCVHLERKGDPITRDSDCVVVITPKRRPSVPAPLGWVLSSMSQTDLHEQLMSQLGTTTSAFPIPEDAPLQQQVGALRSQLRGRTGDPSQQRCVFGAAID